MAGMPAAVGYRYSREYDSGTDTDDEGELIRQVKTEVETQMCYSSTPVPGTPGWIRLLVLLFDMQYYFEVFSNIAVLA